MRLSMVLASSLLALPLAARAQQPPTPPTQAKLADCVRDIKGDSVALYFDERYRLTPVPCATFCRYTHLDPQGNIYGEVRDYRVATQQLAYRQHYAHGVRQGSYEAFYPNGQPQMRGTFSQGAPSGEWQFWYASGKPWQVLRWEGRPTRPWRFVAYWDSTGQQLLANGTGRWRELNPQQQRRLEGQVVNEVPDGDWYFYALAFNASQPLGIETYERGEFKKGRSLGKLGTGTYRDQPRFLPVFDDPSLDGERYQRGSTCEELARQQQASAALHQRLAQQSAQLANVKSLEQPRPAGDYRAYLAGLLHKLADAPSMRQLLLNPAYEATVEADVDALGKLSNFRSASADVERVFTQVVPPLGRWNAGTVNHVPVPGHVKFSLSVLDAHWQLQYQAGATVVAKAPAAP